MYTDVGTQTRADVRRDAARTAKVNELLLSTAKVERAPFRGALVLTWTLSHSEAMRDTSLATRVAEVGGEYDIRPNEVIISIPRSFTSFRAVDLVPELLMIAAAAFVVNLAVMYWRW